MRSRCRLIAGLKKAGGGADATQLSIALQMVLQLAARGIRKKIKSLRRAPLRLTCPSVSSALFDFTPGLIFCVALDP